MGALDDGALPDRRRVLGREGEEAALRRYLAAGYEEAARNWRCRLGEIDLVLVRSGVLVFCEVKARRGGALGGPFEAVTARKQVKLRQLAEAFLAGWPTRVDHVRFDVASVTLDATGRLLVHVFEDAF